MDIARYLERDLTDSLVARGYLDAVFKLKGQTVECIVCFDEMALGPDVYGAAPPTQECNHDRNVCDDCLKTTYETAIQGGQSGDDLTCPDPSCRAVVSMSHLRQTISSDCFKALVPPWCSGSPCRSGCNLTSLPDIRGR